MIKRALLVAFLLSCSNAEAAPTTYRFEGTLTNAHIFTANSAWAFAAGQQFRGTFVWDPDQVAFEGYRIDRPNWTMRTFISPIVSFSYEIDTPQGYGQVVPTQNLTNSARTLASIAKGDDGNGVALDMFNYPINWNSNPPSAALPASAYVGTWAPHNVYLSMFGSDPTTLNEITPDLDLAAVFAKTGGDFAVRFSDPFAWTSGVERLDGITMGRLNLLEKVNAVPEPQTWALMVLGMAAVGFGVRRRPKAGVTAA